MTIGYFLRVGDKSTCGGQILTGDNTMQWYGIAGAREGDIVSCGKHSGVYHILGGVSSIWLEGRKHAGSLESFSSCPCHSRFIPSISDCYSSDDESSINNETELIKNIIPQQVIDKWITFKLPSNRDYSGFNYVVTLDDGQSIKGTFNDENNVKISLKTGSHEASLKIENLEINDASNSLSELLLAKIKG
ncbi:PAAR domain-containing protein [Providencia alcalifaciens]|uniref:PAAR domain-containing protein n=1 Tax=Providencia alcalifaciens TaxID=126385 RepID=UPI001CE16853|nr:PAAR domain-containing protein [Providencia alcalifaciens]UBX48993.1 PAAR domain-containing protein [Providencia alcalifaciens]